VTAKVVVAESLAVNVVVEGSLVAKTVVEED